MVIALGRAIEGDRVGVAAVGHDIGQQAVQGLGVPQLVLGEGAHGHVLFEERRNPRPLGVAEADDELVVRHREQQQRQGVACGRNQVRARRCHPS